MQSLSFLSVARSPDLSPLGHGIFLTLTGSLKPVTDWGRKCRSGYRMKLLMLLPAFLVMVSCSSRLLSRAPASSDEPVVTLEQLKQRLASAKESEVILIGPGVRLDMTGEPTLRLTVPVILKGVKSQDGTVPGFIHRGRPLPLLSIEAPDVRIEDLKFEGVESDSKKDEIIGLNKRGIKGVYEFPVTRGIEVLSRGVVISGCELSGFSHAAVFLKGDSSAYVEKSHIHHNQRWGLGYGVALHDRAQARITDSRFNWNRHSIAASGFPGQAYEADHNWFGPDHSATPLDMHGGKDRGDGTEVAGRRVHIHHNRILSTAVHVFIHRGIPQEEVRIEENELAHTTEKSAIGYYNGVTAKAVQGRFFFERNEFGRN